MLVLCNSLFDNLDLEALKCLFLQVMFNSDTCCIFIFNEINLFLLPCPLCSISNQLLGQLDAMIPAGGAGQQRRRIGVCTID